MHVTNEEVNVMKKKVTVLLLTVATVLSLTACGKFTCDGCGKEKSGKSYKVTVLGQEMTVCKDCKKEVDEAKDALNQLIK